MEVEFMRRRQKNAFLRVVPPPPVEVQPDMHSPVQCKDCGQHIKPRGVHTHKRWCKGKTKDSYIATAIECKHCKEHIESKFFYEHQEACGGKRRGK